MEQQDMKKPQLKVLAGALRACTNICLYTVLAAFLVVIIGPLRAFRGRHRQPFGAHTVVKEVTTIAQGSGSFEAI